MKRISRILNKSGKSLISLMLVLVFAIATVYTVVVSAVESTQTDIVSETDNSTENQLTSEEVDKIIQDLKITGSIENITEKLDEIIQRAQLSGNTALQDYASNMKTSYELQKQLDGVNSLIKAMKKKNLDIDALDKQVSKILSVDTIPQDLNGALSDEALLVLQSLSNDDLKNMTETLAEIESLFDLKDVGSLTIQQRSLLDIIVLSKILEDEVLEGERLELAKDTLGVAVTILESYQKQNYDTPSYDNLTSGTERFLQVGRKASSVLPEQIVFLDGHFNMNYPPLMYDGHVLMALDDLYQYIDAKIDYMYNNATMVITSPEKTLEIVSGKNIAYLNDKPFNMPVPILSFEDTVYMSVEFFAQAYDISYKHVPDHEFIVLYNNLVQLKNPAVPNQLSRD